MSLREDVRTHVRENRSGMLADLAFAVVWVTAVTALFDVLHGPQWAYYLCMLGGVVAHYGFFTSLAVARAQRRAD